MFINGRLAIDLGGIHDQMSATLNLDDIEKSHNLTVSRGMGGREREEACLTQQREGC